jgi:hypothetical protein
MREEPSNLRERALELLGSSEVLAFVPMANHTACRKESGRVWRRTPIAVGMKLEGEEPSDPTGALPAQKGKEASRRQSGTARLEDIATRRTKAVIR